MKITETNSEQWDIKQSGIGAVIASILIAIGGVGALGWIATHLATIAWWWMFVAVGVLGVAVLILFSASSRQITLRKQGMSDVVTTKVIGGKQTKVSFSADQIVSVNLDTSDELRTTTSGDRQETTRERTSLLYILLRDNSEVMIATSKGGNNGITVNGFSLSGLMKAPLADEAQRIATFYGVPLSSRMNNVSGVEALATTLNAVKQGITGVQQPGVVANVAQPQIQSQPEAAVPITPLQPIVPQVVAPIQPVVPVAPLSQVPPVVAPTPAFTGPAPTAASESISSDTQMPR
jgi:MFS family permease